MAIFGKRMSSNAKFVMAAGRAAGNLKGRGTAKKTAPLVQKHGAKAKPAGSLEKLTGPSKDKGMSPGQFGTFKTRGK